jgi:beta-carotene hydroxylase
LRYQEDVKVLIWMVITSGLLVINWLQPEFNWFTFLWACLMAVSVTTITHNHNHFPIWKNQWLNYAQDYWLTLFYGFPTFSWIPTHNKNHHKLNNRAGDYTITYRLSERNNLFTLLTYPTISGYWQQKPIKDFLKHNWRNRRAKFWFYISEYVILALWIGGALWLDWRKALLYVVIPQQVGLFSVLAFNYLQHVGADEESEWEHSRNVISPVMNWLLFNNGYHTVHHNRPGLHWSQLPAKHIEIRHKLNPALTEYSFWWFILRTYFLAPVIPALRRPNLRGERLERERAATRVIPLV